MLKKLIFFCLLLPALFSKAFPAVFVVTSNADSGPGSLRDALTLAAASDSTQINYINFNLIDLSEAGRTITILSQLPDVSSNLIIDGSTQQGTVFGVSSAKIALFFRTPAGQGLSGLRIANKHDVIILSLYIKNLTDLSTQTTNYFWKGIEIINSNNIEIGQLSKGNVILGFNIPLSTNWFNTGSQSCRNLALKNNFFNIEPDGETLPIDEETPVDLNDVAGQIKIGGTFLEGNLLAYGLQIYQLNSYASYDTVSAYFMIKNNKIGVDYNVQTAIFKSSGINAETKDPNGTNTINIEDNIITSASYAVFGSNIGQKITILRNYIGTDQTLTKSFKTGGIFMYGNTQVAIGSMNPADANYITNCTPVQVWPYTNATVNKNSFFCTTNYQPMHLGGYGSFPFPVVSITNISSGGVSGTATPYSSVELFYSDRCGTCSPQTFFASALADNNGKWQYNGALTGSVIASSTINGNTSDFTRTSINIDSVKIANACNNANGSIKGIVPQSGKNLKWFDVAGHVVGTAPDLLNVKPGKYKLLAQNGDCADSTSYFEIKNDLEIITNSFITHNASCNNSDGSISGFQLINNDNNQPVIAWKDVNGKVVGNLLSLTNVPSGNYTLQVVSADGNCTQSYGPVILTNTTGPNIDQSNIAIQSTNCGQSAGSITNLNITGTGTLKYIWWNSNQQTVSTTQDLLNQPAGIYKLQVTDDTQCGPVYSTYLVIPETNGITLDETGAIISQSRCNNNNGAVTGIAATNATKYTWTNNLQQVVGTSADLTNVPAGDYVLTASNNNGCDKVSKTYHIDMIPPIIFPLYGDNIMSSCKGMSNGFVNVVTNNLVMAMRWENSQGTTIGTGPQIENLAPGTYTLYLTDQNGCESLYRGYNIDEIAPLTILPGTAQITNDQCDLKTGNINNIQVSGGVSPYNYSWSDANGKVIATSGNLNSVGQGSYTLSVSDNSSCNYTANQTYQVQNIENFISAPAVNNVQLCTPGPALLTVNSPSSAIIYRLYSSATGTSPLDEQSSGQFKINASTNVTYYISAFSGSCESERQVVQVVVGITAISIANTITPNGDGINDYWKITSIENYPAAVVQVFSRYGEKVFDSKGYSRSFDGTYNGKPLPAGVYYYIINLNTSCNLLSGSLTIIR